MRSVTGPAIGRPEDHGLERAALGGVTPPSQGRAIPPCPTAPVIDVLMGWQPCPTLGLPMVRERAPLPLARAVVWLLTGGDSRLEGDLPPCPPAVPAGS
jgi:hypothetical protein